MRMPTLTPAKLTEALEAIARSKAKHAAEEKQRAKDEVDRRLLKTCGARTKSKGGTPCRQRALGAGGRCRYHGGKSTGPSTPEGRARIAEAQRKRWTQYRAQHPRLFQSEVSARQERRIRKAWRDAKAKYKVASGMRQPVHRVTRLERLDRDERIQEHGRELIKRYGLDRRRPAVKVGYAAKKYRGR